MLRAMRTAPPPEDPVVLEGQLIPEAVHDPLLEDTVRRLAAPPPAPAAPPAPRPREDRAVYGLD
jgi:hypothetical protein